MKTASTALKLLLAGGDFVYCDLYSFTLPGGDVIRLCGGDRLIGGQAAGELFTDAGARLVTDTGAGFAVTAPDGTVFPLGCAISDGGVKARIGLDAEPVTLTLYGDDTTAFHGGVGLQAFLRQRSERSLDPHRPRLFAVVGIYGALLRIWYPITVATISRGVRDLIRAALVRTADAPDAELPFKLHDFGARGVSSEQSAALGGMAHLVNFQGSDTLSAIVAAKRFYGESLAGFSIPAAEHSTITSWERANEAAAYANMVQQFARPGSIFAVVSDSYDLYHAVDHLWSEQLRQSVADSGATLVVRPDSGDPVEVVSKTLSLLANRFGTTTNGKGYRVLNNVRVIQGDGVNPQSITAILERIIGEGFSASNLAFGMGGALLQKCDRDTMAFAYKTSAACVGGTWRDVYKDPVPDSGKRSKRGLLGLSETLRR